MNNKMQCITPHTSPLAVRLQTDIRVLQLAVFSTLQYVILIKTEQNDDL